jgi:quinol monooxygenase YgiN
MYGLIVTINIKPGFKDQFMEALMEDARGSVNNEPGCLRFDVLEDSEEPNRIYLMEEYRDEAAFQAHTQQPHMTKWRDAVKDWFASPTQVSRTSGIYPPGK